MADPRPLFAARLERWLEDVKEGLGSHAGVIISYGATSYEDMASLDKRDIEALGICFAKAGVAPLQVRRLVDKIPSMIGEARGDLETPIPRQPTSSSAGTSRSTAHGAAWQKTWQHAFEVDDEEQHSSSEHEDGDGGESGDGAYSNDGESDGASNAPEDEMELARQA